jgi:hypothetical protein
VNVHVRFIFVDALFKVAKNKEVKPCWIGLISVQYQWSRELLLSLNPTTLIQLLSSLSLLGTDS